MLFFFFVLLSLFLLAVPYCNTLINRFGQTSVGCSLFCKQHFLICFVLFCFLVLSFFVVRHRSSILCRKSASVFFFLTADFLVKFNCNLVFLNPSSPWVFSVFLILDFVFVFWLFWWYFAEAMYFLFFIYLGMRIAFLILEVGIEEKSASSLIDFLPDVLSFST